jgi:hypothetical protein
VGWWTSARKAYALNYLLGAGLSPYGAAGLVSRWANVEASGGPSSVNPYSGAFGIAQWLGSRLPPIRGNTNFDAQLSYVVQELNGPESRAADVLWSAQSAWEGARGASMYERAEGYNAATGVDNFTQRTANGIPAILASAPAQTQTINPVIPIPFDVFGSVAGDDGDWHLPEYQPQADWPIEDLTAVNSGMGVGSVLLICLGVLILVEVVS